MPPFPPASFSAVTLIAMKIASQLSLAPPWRPVHHMCQMWPCQQLASGLRSAPELNHLNQGEALHSRFGGIV
jgi:hypothetical protein